MEFVALRTFGFATAVAAALGITSSTSAADWPQWRGPNRDGVSKETGLLKKWPEQGPSLLWKASGLGSGYATVSVVGDRIYTTGDRGDASFIIALNLADGKQVWSVKLGRSGAPGWGGFAGPRATPTIDGELLYTVNQWGEMVCVKAADGAEVWRKDLSTDFGGTRPEWGFSESPLVDGDQVVVTPGGDAGSMVGLDKKTGALIWHSKGFTDPAHYSSVVVAEIGGVRQYVQLTAQSVVGVAPKTGEVLWQAKRKGQTAVIPDPIAHQDMVFVTSGYGVGCNLFKISKTGDRFSAEQVYANKVMVNHHGGVVRLGDHLYGYSEGKGWTCQDFKTGEAKWQEKKLGKGSLVYADGCLYLRSEEKRGTVVLLEASANGYNELGRFDQPDRSDKQSWPHPVVVGGRLFLRDQDILLCYDVKAK
jgi:outer membrane protein assembly factor BamB